VRECLRSITPGASRIRSETKPLSVYAQMGHERCGHDESGQETSSEQRRNGGIGEAAIDHHGQTGWHQDTHAGSSGHDRTGMCATEALPLHRRNHY
jgi:hypothetical protein